MLTTGSLPRRLQLQRRLLADIASGRHGRFILVTGPKGVDKERFIRELAIQLGDFQVLTQPALRGFSRPTVPTVILAGQVHRATNLDEVLAVVHDVSAPQVIILGTAPHSIDEATEVVSLSPLNVSETQQLVVQTVGVCSPRTAHRIHDASGGLPQLIRELLSAAPMEHWAGHHPGNAGRNTDPIIIIPEHWGRYSGELLQVVASYPLDGALLLELPEHLGEQLDIEVSRGVLAVSSGRVYFSRPEVRAVVRSSTPPSLARALSIHHDVSDWDSSEQLVDTLFARGDLPLARMHAQDLPQARPELSLYEGQATTTANLLRGAQPSALTALQSLASWQPQGIRAFADDPAQKDSHDAASFRLLADALEFSTRPQPLPTPDTVLEKQLRTFITGWLALVFDDPTQARQLLSHRWRGDSDLLGLWQDAFLARAHYVLGEFSAASAVVERGLATGDRTGTPLLEPVLLWTGAQVAGLSGHAELSRHYLSRMNVTNSDSFMIQKLPSAMGRMIVSTMMSDTRTAALAGEQLASIAYTTDTQQPGFWAWEDMYAVSLIRSGRVDTAALVMEENLERHNASGILSLRARNLVPRANIEIQRGATARGVKMLSEAVDAITSVNMPAYEARILFEFGLVLRRMGRRSQAAEMFTRAEEVFNAMGAITLAARCAGERKVSGLGGTRRSAQGLTPQEEQITALVVEGASNSDVARELSLSTKTVEYHLTRVYRKFGVTGRVDLRAVLKNQA